MITNRHPVDFAYTGPELAAPGHPRGVGDPRHLLCALGPVRPLADRVRGGLQPAGPDAGAGALGIGRPGPGGPW
jgi:hypothetical protein